MSLNVKATGDSKQAVNELKRLNDQVNKLVDNVKRTSSGMGEMTKSFISAQAIYAGAQKTLSFIKNELGQVINKTSSLTEETNKFNVIYSKVFPQASKSISELRNNYGLSELASKKLLSATGDLLTGFGFAQKEALKFSTGVQKAAVDLASFSNISGGAEEVSRRITASLTGETEGLKLLGVVIRQNSKEFKDNVKSIMETQGATEQVAKAQVIYNEILKQSTNAIGDFARSNQQFENLGRQTNATIEDIYTNLGQRLLPTLTNVRAGFLNFLKGLEDLTKVKASKAIEEERLQVNQLIISLANANISEEERAKKLIELEKINPQVARTIKTEGINLKNLKQTLDSVNQSYAAQILIKDASQNLDKEQSKTAALTAKAYLERDKILKQFIKRVQETGNKESDLILIQRLQSNDLKEMSKAAMELNKRFNDLNAVYGAGNISIDKFNRASGLAISRTFNLSEAEKAYNETLSEYLTLSKKTENTGPISNDVSQSQTISTDINTTGLDTTIEKTKELKTVIEQGIGNLSEAINPAISTFEKLGEVTGGVSGAISSGLGSLAGSLTNSFVEFNDVLNAEYETAEDKSKAVGMAIGSAIASGLESTQGMINSVVSSMLDLNDQYLNERISKINASLEKEKELINSRYDSEKERIAEALETVSIDQETRISKAQDEYNRLLELNQAQVESLGVIKLESLKQDAQTELEKAKKEQYLKDEQATLDKKRRTELARAESKARKKEDKEKEKAFEAEKASKIAMLWVNFALGLAGLWAMSLSQLGPIAGSAVAGALSAVLTGVTIAQTAIIAQQKYVPAFADGVTNFSGGTALVGERGPELVTLGRGSNVVTNENVNKMMNGNGNMFYINEMYVMANNSEEFARSLNDQLIENERYQRARG